MDNHLLHLLEARRGLLRRWKRQRHNRKLRIRIAKLNNEAAKYAAHLSRQNWLQTCDSLNGRLSTSRTWNLLRYLIEPTKSRGETSKAMQTILHQYPGSTEDLMKTLKTKYFPDTPKVLHPAYTGPPNPTLDQPITAAEVRAALAKVRRNTSPGMDKVTNKALANLEEGSILALTEFKNECWTSGTLPIAWKEAEVRLLPKPGRTLSVDNLRPISLTSCIGKVMEHFVLIRLQTYLETTGKLPHTMFGFRPHLSTHDILLQLKTDIFEVASKTTPKGIHALDLKGAFDNVAHASILKNLSDLAIGERMYEYIKDFLTDRQAMIRIGDLQSQIISCGSRGTPQGAVLSPILFNVALINLPTELAKIPDIHHGIYADDITLWISKGSAGTMQDRLQEAANVVQAYAKRCGPQKTELLLVQKR